MDKGKQQNKTINLLRGINKSKIKGRKRKQHLSEYGDNQ